MKKIYLLILAFISVGQTFGQLVNYEVEIVAVERTNYTDCGGCGAPDATWLMDLSDNASPTIDEFNFHIPDGSASVNNIGLPISNRINSSATTFDLYLEAWEDNCNNDVFNFNSYNFFTCFPSVFGDDRNGCSGNSLVASVNFRAQTPCTWHTGTTSWCGEYRYYYRYRWSYNQAPTIAAQPTPSNSDLCPSDNVTFTVTSDVDATYGWNLTSNYQWQVSEISDCASATPSSWTDVGGATLNTFTPPNTPGTRLYRVLMTPNCNSNFSTNTTASNCVRVSYNPLGTPGDLPPPIQSGICGSIVLPGTSHNLSALIPPAANVPSNVTYSWSATAGTFSTTAGSNVVWTAPTTQGTYTITLTYNDACPGADAFSTCIIEVGSENCEFAYVSVTDGIDDVFSGGPDNPYQSLSYALTQLAGRKYIRMDEGTYFESVVIHLEDDLVIEGGYEFTAGIWRKKSDRTTTLVLSGFEDAAVTGSNDVEHRLGIYGNDDDNFILQDLVIQTTNITGTTPSSRGRSNYAILLHNGCENYNIVRCDITSGDASRGINGFTPSGNGPNGGTSGGNGGAGGDDGNDPAEGSPGQSGTAAAYNPAIHPTPPGGALGNGAPTNFTGACGGQPCSSAGAFSSGDPCSGSDGLNGEDGEDGATWNAGDRPIVGITSIPYYVPGGYAGEGQDGGGAGKGSGGNGGRGDWLKAFGICTGCDGADGGNGGNGGRGGRGGIGGYGSGSSFAIYRHNSDAGAVLSQIVLNIPGSVASGGTGGNGQNGQNGFNGSNGFTTTGCVYTANTSGDGGNGGNGGNGGRGRDGSNGVNAHLVTNGVGSNPSSTIPSLPIVSIAYNNGKACINSEINLSKNSPNSWVLSLPFINDVSGSPAPLTTSSFVSSDNDVIVFSSTPGELVDLGVQGTTFEDYLHISDDVRPIPVLSVSPSNLVCIGSNVSLSATSWAAGNEVEYDWRIYTANNVNNPSLTPSTLASPTFNFNGLNPGLYTVRYKVREICCGWSVPVYDTIRIIDVPIVYQVEGGGGYCPGTSGSVVTLSGSESGVTYELLLNGGPVDTIIGTGSTISFTPQLIPGTYTIVAESISGCISNMQGNVNIFAHPQPNDQNFTGNQFVCNLGNTDTDLSLDDSEIGVSYQLILDDTVSINVPIPGNGFGISLGTHSTAGQYTVQATSNITGCNRFLTDTLNVQILPGPTTFNLTGGGGYCAGANGVSIGLDSSETNVFYQLTWNYTVPIDTAILGTGNSLDFGNHSLEGNYTVVATDANGCQTIMMDTLRVDELFLPTFDNLNITDLLCNGDSTASIVVSATSYNGGLSYVLDMDTNTTGTFSNLGAGSYILSMFDDSLCSVLYPISPINIEEPEPININIDRISNVSCFGGNDGELLISVSNGTAPYSVLWSPTGDTITGIDSLTAGIYTVTVTDANNCSTSIDITITEPTEIQTSIAPTQPGCPGEETGFAAIGVNGGTPPYTYEWNTSPAQFGIVATQLSGDQWYQVAVTDFNGCMKLDSVFVQNPDTMTISVQPGNTSCIGGTDGFAYIEVLGGSAPYSYELNGIFQSDSLFVNLPANDYYAFVEDNQGCTADAQFSITPNTALDVTLYGTSLSDVNVTDEMIIVADEPVGLNAVLSNTNDSTQIIEYIWMPIANMDFTVCNFDTLCPNPDLTTANTIQVVVEVIELVNGVGCSTFDTLDITVRTDNPAFFPTAFSPLSDDFKTDCLNDYFEMNIAGAENLDVKIFNRWGELVFANPNQKNAPNNPDLLDCTNPRNAWDGTYKGKPVPMGAYIYQVTVSYFNGDIETFSGSITVLR